MINTGKLAGKTILITGASRGIGKAIALKAAKDGANIVVAAKTAEPHKILPGTIYTAAEEIEKCGGKALPCVVDVRDEAQVQSAVEQAVKKFGGIDIVVNNASAINLIGTEELTMKKYDLMQDINTRGTFLVSKLCIPYLKKSSHAHILTLSPPLDMKSYWFAPHVGYTISKFGMSMCVLGFHEELRPYNIAVNALWPRTAIQTAALDMLTEKQGAKYSRKPEIMSDAAYAILIQDPKSPKATGNFYIDDDVLRSNGITDLDQYCNDPAYKDQLMPDYFVGEDPKLQSSRSFLNFDKETSAEKGQSAEPQGQVAGLFKKIEASLTEEVVKSTEASFQFVVTGKEEGKWYLDLKSGSGKCGQGEAPTSPDATLQMDSENFFKMFTGKIKPATAYMTGRLKIKGNLQKALKLEKLMNSLKTKL
ncbi:hydroxysteroid dehydrogenase-like protein 2 [Coccinella septempunctata]|uniref:hydroxysteroid dehydrogenase-like protein 2 n=1 Tax=Coccinella septempunctata TaxID=41139 RepID=UPI001D086658|nr:hydroxysteroid dehydrogenase-like protein 2 [Coccinella septempunctata]